MGLFKKRNKQVDASVQATDQVFDTQYRDELRQMARERFEKLFEQTSADLKQDSEAVLEQLTSTLRRHMAGQLDVAITRMSNEISSQLRDTMNEYNRVSRESQDMVLQSLTRNAQTVHEKYQSMSNNLQQVVASQEVMMVGVFQDNKSRISTVQDEQEKALQSMREGTERLRNLSDQLQKEMQDSAAAQSEKLSAIYQENISRLESSRNAQDTTLQALRASTEQLLRQHEQLRDLLEKSVADQKAMVTDVINENMSRIVEHYVVGALGDQSDLKAQLPSILHRLEENKQAMVDDMNL